MLNWLTKKVPHPKWLVIYRLSLFLSLQASKHKRTDRSVLCCLKKAEAGRAWPRLTKDKAKVGTVSMRKLCILPYFFCPVFLGLPSMYLIPKRPNWLAPLPWDALNRRRSHKTGILSLMLVKIILIWDVMFSFSQFQWLGVDFNNWKDWEDDSDEDLSSFDKFSEASMSRCTKCVMF